MSRSLSSLIFPAGAGYDGGSSVALVSIRGLFVKQGEVLKWRVHAEAREDASDATKAPLTQNPISRAESEPSSTRGAAKGFGPRPPPPPPKSPKPSSVSKDKNSVTSRRPASSRPVGLSNADPVIGEQDNSIIVGLTVLGALIFVEGMILAGSGFLPDELDALVVKYVYPAFTPTVGLFIAGAVFYGVFKLRQGGGDERN